MRGWLWWLAVEGMEDMTSWEFEMENYYRLSSLKAAC